MRTRSEKRAWEALRLLRDEGVHIVRQHRISRYTVDFAIRRARLAIEIDGEVHNFPGRPEYDAARQALLESKGWRFFRFSTAESFDASLMLHAVLAAPPPSPRGEGEFEPHLRRRTRANRKLKPRRKG
jgi:very-short-patch-repair endonuclease